MDFIKINNKFFIKLKKTKFIRKLSDGKGGFKYIYKEGKENKPNNLTQMYEKINKLKQNKKYKNYSLGIRFTETPKDDIERGWSAWMGSWRKTFKDVLEDTPAIEDIDEKWEKWQDEEHATYHHRDHDDHDAFLKDLAEDNDVDIRFDEKRKEYALVHHDGLSIYAYEDTPIKEIDNIKEIKNFSDETGVSFKGGEGDQSIGEIILLGKLGDDKYLFAMEDYEKEIV